MNDTFYQKAVDSRHLIKDPCDSCKALLLMGTLHAIALGDLLIGGVEMIKT